jgi:dihydrofolate reductase
MGRVITSATMSLDGFIAYNDHTVGPLFDWYDAGEVEIANAGETPSFTMDAASADYWRKLVASIGVLVVGRRLFDVTDGWKGVHPFDVPIVVMTHQPPSDWSYPGSEDFHFATDGVGAAVALARTLAGDRDVCLAAGSIARQALEAGLLDEVAIDLVPVGLGTGRPYFGPFGDGATRLLGDPTVVVRGTRATHLRFPVLRA